MVLLQLLPSPTDLLSGLSGDIFKSETNSHSSSSLVGWLIFAACFVVLSEPLKVIIRRNVGSRVINIFFVIGASAIYLAWAFVIVGSYFLFTMDPMDDAPAYAKFLVSLYLLIPGLLIYLFLAFYTLKRGMEEYYRSKSIESMNWEVLEYRGDSIMMKDYKAEDRSQNKLWRFHEPKVCFFIALVITIIHFGIGLPLLVTATSFWVNEWYHVHYKVYRMKQSFLDMKIEMEKASQFYNQSMFSSTAPKVSTDD